MMKEIEMSDAILSPEARKRLHDFIDTMDSPETTGCLIQVSVMSGINAKTVLMVKGYMQDAVAIKVLLQSLQKMLSHLQSAKAHAIQSLIEETEKALDGMVAKDLGATSAAMKKTAENATWN